jgi:hypothetical protein
MKKEAHTSSNKKEKMRWRAANPGRDKARIAAMSPDEKAVYNARRAEYMRRLRAK